MFKWVFVTCIVIPAIRIVLFVVLFMNIWVKMFVM